MDEAFNARFQLDERAKVSDLSDGAGNDRFGSVPIGSRIPRIRQHTFHGQADFAFLSIDLEDLDVDFLTHAEHFTGMLNVCPGNLPNVQEAVGSTKINKGSVIFQSFDFAFEFLVGFQAFPEFRFHFLASLRSRVLAD